MQRQLRCINDVASSLMRHCVNSMTLHRRECDIVETICPLEGGVVCKLFFSFAVFQVLSSNKKKKKKKKTTRRFVRPFAVHVVLGSIPDKKFY